MTATEMYDALRLHGVDWVIQHLPRSPSSDAIRQALQLSSHVLNKDPSQFASQMTGRLEGQDNLSGLDELPGIWLRPMRRSLHPPGTALVRSLEGHHAHVQAVAITCDGK